jgi:hypothetical protein
MIEIEEFCIKRAVVEDFSCRLGRFPESVSVRNSLTCESVITLRAGYQEILDNGPFDAKSGSRGGCTKAPILRG